MPVERRKGKSKSKNDSGKRPEKNYEEIKAEAEDTRPLYIKPLRGALIITGLLFLVNGVVFAIWGTATYLKKIEEVTSTPTPGEVDSKLGYRQPFEVLDLPGRGKGLIATRDIEQGELLIKEKPLFVVPPQITTSPTELVASLLGQLPVEGRDAFWNLSYVNFPRELVPEEHPDEVALAIFETNAVSAGDSVGIFPRMARLNHGCSGAFNSVYSWREREGALYVHALKPVKKGEELLTVYTNTKQRRSDRRAYLERHYGFRCACRVCSLEDESSRQSDNRLLAIAEEYQKFSGWGQEQIDGREAIETVKRLWKIEDEEGYWSERGQLAADAAWVAASHSDGSATKQWAELAVKWFTFELGRDSEQVVNLLPAVNHPQKHTAWAQRGAMIVGGPDGL
ncbi:hypothetical protein BDN72DRAFT_856973 [Pluteus cervinus]|uniref:Uncharacterized protein n=1 Tax=Pluteus cervinus TaxID=181527 RepID=A0ACD3AYD3_9AGAR|nr:hypothetical protein BDN72DRAFT_856973 [Pluteus cervinus]